MSAVRDQLAAIVETTLQNPLSQLFNAQRHALDAVAALAEHPGLLRQLADEVQPVDRGQPSDLAEALRLLRPLGGLDTVTGKAWQQVVGELALLHTLLRPRVWRDGEPIPNGTWVRNCDGDVFRVRDPFDPPSDAIGFYGRGPLVEVVLPDYDAAVAADPEAGR